MTLDNISSVINNSPYAIDTDRALTFIEFIKQYGFDNSQETFLTTYKEYLTRWADKKNDDTLLSDEEFIRQKMIEILKSITLTYSSYEEQQFIGSLDWTDIEQIKTVIPLYVRKIKEICEFYRGKRNEAPLIVAKNRTKGSYQSIEQIIYEKVIDFLFNNRNLQPQISELKQNLMISIEQYVDTYSEYFDIPREKKFRKDNENRESQIGINMTDIDYRDYIEINTVINEIIYTGEVYLEEIPLIANLGIDFGQPCVGEMAELRKSLIASATINRIPLTEQVNIRRKFYEKYLGCDLYYMYVDDVKNVHMDVLCEAKNPSGNLINTQTPDRAVTFADQIELLSHIGLFFKPDKTSILKIGAKDFSWEVDKDKLIEDTVYVFPDPNKYGDIGNNKDPNYPIIMEYRLDYDIRNLSSGNSMHDPLMLIDEQVWNSYYSKQQDIFKAIDNKNFEYSFTSLANIGFIHNYQVDIFGNEFALYKGYSEVWIEDPETGEKILDHIEIPDKFNPGIEYPDDLEDFEQRKNYIINGGYFEDPFNVGHYQTINGEKVYIPGKKFNYERRLTMNDYYHWSGLKLGKAPLVTPSFIYPEINFGQFGDTRGYTYTDHFQYTESRLDLIEDHEDIIGEVLPAFGSQLYGDDEDDIPVVTVHKSFTDLQSEAGTLFIKNSNEFESRPLSLANCFSWLPDDIKSQKIKDFWVMKQILILELEEEYVFIPYLYEDGEFRDGIGLNKLIRLPKDEAFWTKPLWNEKESVFYITLLEPYLSEKDDLTLVPIIYKFNPATYDLSESVNGWKFITEFKKELNEVSKAYYYPIDKLLAERAKAKKLANGDKETADAYLFSNNYNLLNFNLSYQPDITDSLGANIAFSYNNNLNLYLLAYIYTDLNGLPSIYEHKFKLGSNEVFNRTIMTNLYTVGVSPDSRTMYNEGIISGMSSSIEGAGKYFFEKIK